MTQIINKTILVREERTTNRKHLNIEEGKLPFVGFDTWDDYEFTYLSNNGILEAGILKICYDCNSKYIVESKSLKSYLNSFNLCRYGEPFTNCNKVTDIIKHDLSELLETDVKVHISPILIPSRSITRWDNDEPEISQDKNKNPNVPAVWALLNFWGLKTSYTGNVYSENPTLLKLSDNQPAKTPQAYWSNTLFSHCKLTKQPIHGDIYIYYDGDKRIDASSLLQYITSLKDDCYLQEEICEIVYKRLYDFLNSPTNLAVACLFTRQDGIDINPVRASNKLLLNMLFSELHDTNILHTKSMKQ